MKPSFANVAVMTLVSRDNSNQSKKLSFEQNSTINHYFCFSSLKAWLTWGTQQHSRMLAC